MQSAYRNVNITQYRYYVKREIHINYGYDLIFVLGTQYPPISISTAPVRLYPKSQITDVQLFEKLENGVNDTGVLEYPS